MTIITGISDQPKQTLNLMLPDGTAVSMAFTYVAQQKGWFVDFTYGVLTVNGLRLTSSPNFLRKWINLIPFGMAALTANNAEPLDITDLADGTTVLYLLSTDDVYAVESMLGSA